jgi:hypothetical protein
MLLLRKYNLNLPFSLGFKLVFFISAVMILTVALACKVSVYLKGISGKMLGNI